MGENFHGDYLQIRNPCAEIVMSSTWLVNTGGTWTPYTRIFRLPEDDPKIYEPEDWS